MPVYELFCVLKPKISDPIIKGVIKRASQHILNQGGVLLGIKSYGEKELAYQIKRPDEKGFEQAMMWGLDFAVGPTALKELEHDLRVTENVLRWKIFKRKPYPNLPKLTKLFYIPELDNPNRKRRNPVYPPSN